MTDEPVQLPVLQAGIHIGIPVKLMPNTIMVSESSEEVLFAPAESHEEGLRTMDSIVHPSYKDKVVSRTNRSVEAVFPTQVEYKPQVAERF